mmetsp:Transcript_28338/g.47548  ORF Transcript_28338/g.47548 Transcript_28338/m.47548 type:complete len:564 (+) Transcript_28338:208-1899(+)|eukprot:CAMPEP_0198213046 /NCGR_PEP_ID=MMETSP1445-20131203/28644_1 /TAXON_ID=36898 /ORGANISM="Pyramimonas sp., Strain CCMP2087" /LENGTH=563 /DNA_ID=CAMNT_0043887637 /DNA_START=50 /DNA_END=1741 /DNA_ORIENTATION=+
MAPKFCFTRGPIALALVACFVTHGVHCEPVQPESGHGTDFREIDGAPFKVISTGLASSTIGCETTLKTHHAHKYTYDRKQRSDLSYVWNTVTIQLKELDDTSCALELTVTDGESNHTMKARRDATFKASVIPVSPFGGPLSLSVQCKKSGFGSMLKTHPSASAWYNLTITNGLSYSGPAVLTAALTMLAIAPMASHSVSAFYVGGVTLTFMMFSIILLYQMSKRFPGGQKASGIFVIMYSVMPPEWREATTYHYLYYVLWPFKQIYKYIQYGAYDTNEHVAVGAAVLMLWGSALVGVFTVRRFAINRETGSVEKSAADFVVWTLRALALLLLLFGASHDHQVRMAITAAVGGVMVPPGSWIVAGLFRIILATIRFVTLPTRLLVRLMWWFFPLKFLFHRRKTQKSQKSQPALGDTHNDDNVCSEEEGGGEQEEGPRTPPTYSTPPRGPAEYLTPGASGGHWRADGSSYLDPEYRTPAKPTPTQNKPPAVFAAAVHKRWLTAEEVQRQMEITTASELDALFSSPTYNKWMKENHKKVRNPHLTDDLSDEDEDEDDGIPVVKFHS